MKPHAYTYIRWSSAEQAAGSSLARQRERIAQIAAGTGLPIAELEIDDGVSAATGKNQRSGPLAEFLALVDAGRVAPGSALCVEDVDRLSRAGPLNTLQLVDRLARRGVRVVTGDGVFDLNDAGSSIAGTVKSILAQLENAKKSKRVSEAWRKKREAARTGGVYHGAVPAWLHVGKNGYEVDRTAAATVRKIFKLSAQGLGAQKIANLFNSEGVPLIGKRPARAWFASYIRRIIRGRGVLGEVTTSTGETLNVYPPIITPATWHAAQHAFKPRGRPSAQERNLFRGLIFSGRDGSSMQHRHKPPYAYLTSADTLEKRAARGHSVTYREDELVEWITTYGPRAIARAQSEEPERLDELRAEVAEAERKLGNLLALAEAGGELPRSVLARIAETEKARDKARAQLAEAEAKPITATPVPLDLKTPEGRARYRRDLARVIAAIWIDDDDGSAVRVQFRGESVAWSGTLPDRLHDDEAVTGKLTHRPLARE